MVYDQPLKVPIVPLEISHAESLHQILDSLQYLSSAIDSVFNSISQRVNIAQNTLNNFNQRIDISRQKIQHLSNNPSRATTVHSAAKYPSYAEQTNTSLKNKDDDIIPRHHKLFTDDIQFQNPTHQLSSSYNQAAKTQDNVDTSKLLASLFSNIQYQPHSSDISTGLGRLPPDVRNISSILLFNTSENPYKSYISIDNLEGVQGRDKIKEQPTLAPAPQTLIDGDVLPQYGGLNINFQPVMRDAPKFNLPSVLPDLPGIADIQWSYNVTDQLPSIAPSTVQLSLPTLPTIEDFTIKANVPPPSIANIPIPPPLPFEQNNISIDTNTVMIGSIPPPPPINVPFQPPFAEAIPAATAPSNTKDDSNGVVPSTLLQSIRNPNIKLRKVTDEMIQDRKKKKIRSKTKQNENLSMLDSLRESLLFRAKAIRGKSGESRRRKNSETKEEEWEDSD